MHAIQITFKDLRLLYRDRRTLSVLVALPLAFISILGFSTGQLFNQGMQSRTIRVGIFDADGGGLSTMFVAELSSIKGLDVSEFADRPAARAALAEDKIHAVLYIGPAYHERVEELDVVDVFEIEEGRLAGSPRQKLAKLDVAVEAGSFFANALELVQHVAFTAAWKTITKPVVAKKDPVLAGKFEVAIRKSRKAAEEAQEEAPSEPAPEPEPARTFTNIVYQVLVPSYTVMFVFFIVNFMARSFIGEREMGTLNRLTLAPVTRSGIMIGKTIPFLAISLVQTVLLFVAGKLLFAMSWGPEPWLLLPVMLCTSLAATSLGLMVATLVRTEAQVSAYGSFLVLTLAGISGCMMPRTWQPELMQKVGLVTPHAWALIAYDQILTRDSPELTVVWKCCGYLLAFTAAFFAIGWSRS